MAKLILCHGFNVKDAGKETIDKLLPHLQRHEIYQADYGYVGLLGVRLFNENIAATIAGMAQTYSVGIGHSNGCAILLRAARQTHKIKRLVLINPALDADSQFPESLERIDVFHNIFDRTVTRSKWLWRHEWGEMGRTGYIGDDDRVRNHETATLFDAVGHSGVLHDKSDSLAWYLDNQLDLKNYCSECGR